MAYHGLRVIWRFPTSKVQVQETAVYGEDSEGKKTQVRICWFLLRFFTVTSSPKCSWVIESEIKGNF